jgi:thiamine pyrophosphate-dependent acetolactate synthase large subunit-like protein
VNVYGSDIVVDLLQQAGIRHVALNPGSSVRGIHDSLAHTTDAPELVLCLHEGVAVAAAHGYVKASGQPMAVLLHDVVGLQNASMAIDNAWRDRAAMLLLGGTGPKSTSRRRPWIDWIHTASAQGQVVRDFVVWADEPHDAASVPQSFIRAFHAATAVPPGPVYLCYDAGLQEDEVDPHLPLPRLEDFARQSPPAATREDLQYLAARIDRARQPVFLAGHVGSNLQAFTALAVLAETCGAAVVDTCSRHAFATTHPLCATGVPGIFDSADLIVALDVDDLQGALAGSSAEVVSVSLGHLRLRSWAQDYQALVPCARLITADADHVVGDVLKLLRAKPPDQQAVAERTGRIADCVSEARRRWGTAAASSAADDAVPLDRLVYETGRALASERYVLANGTIGHLEHRLWALDRPGQYLGSAAGGGLGYGVGASLGASVALGPGTVCVDIQNDGDLLYLPSALWTAARLSTATLFVVNNNQQYGNTVEHAQKIAGRRGRTRDRSHLGSRLTEPTIDLAGLARSFGLWAYGPICDADLLAEKLAQAVSIVRSGRPALLDVRTSDPHPLSTRP